MPSILPRRYSTVAINSLPTKECVRTTAPTISMNTPKVTLVVKEFLRSFPIEIHDILDAADFSGIGRQGGNVVSGKVLQREFSAAGHELPEPLGQPLVVSKEAKGSWRYFLKLSVP